MKSEERTPLMGRGLGRDSSTFRLHTDTHTLVVNPSEHNKKKETKQPDHSRTSSSMTEIIGNITHLSGGEDRETILDRSRKKMRRNKHLQTKILIGTCYLIAFVYTCIILIGPFILSFQQESDWCPLYHTTDGRSLKKSKSSPTFNWDIPIEDRQYNNPDFDQNPCHHVRVPLLCWLTMVECDMSRRMLTSVILGGAIGYERRTSDRPAGIRTMGLVSLGACFFTISSIMAFRSSTMGWDASRVTAALPSGVGFLGAALIWKGSIGDNGGEVHQVHGLTTAASLWLSAAIGVGAGGALYFVSIYSTVLILLVLRFGPTFYLQDDSDIEVEGEEEEEDGTLESERDLVRERWLQGGGSTSTLQTRGGDDEHSLDASLRSEQRVTFVQAGFPEALTSEDRRSSVHTVGSSSRAGSVVSRADRLRRQSQYEPPTFHS